MVGRIPVLDVRPLVDCGRRPAKAVAGETFPVTATVFREGHDAVNANVVLRGPNGQAGPWTPMRELAPGTDRWGADVTPTGEGLWTYAVEAWSDPVETWRHHAKVKIPVGMDTELVLEEGALLLERAAAGVPEDDGRAAVLAAVTALRDSGLPPMTRLAAAVSAEVAAVLVRHPLRELVTSSRPLPLQVDRPRALFGSWYEFFPRSEGAVVDPAGLEPPRSGTLRTAAERLPAVAEMGFDVVYLPPIHPIGRAFRKGPNNTLTAGPHDVGSPWAIGSPEGGHDAVHPDLGTIEDFDAFTARARELGMEVALDFALQCSPDHPWVEKHPEWFRHRADGSIAYAENPPKKYQDIYPIDFDRDFDGLVRETLRVLRFWMDHGVRIFRVDNPHTKPVLFWERVLADIARTDPDVLFLAEAFTRPAMMHTLGKIGFHQSYTYFTWRNGKQELTEYLTELSGEAASYMRPNFFVNTPDILHAVLQHGGPAAFALRAVLGAALSPSWGVYAGYELYEGTAVRPGSEEYLDSEKYQLRPRDWAAAEAEGRTLAPLITALNRLRRRHPALRELRNIRFHHADNDSVLAFSKRTTGAGVGGAGAPSDHDDAVLVVVNLDPHHAQEATVSLDLPALGLEWHDHLTVRDELTGATYRWGQHNYVRLDPSQQPAHILTVRRTAE
ncbi:alpha-1,4-glucan--maltose-1-phosphate maltosyltransferase [Streptacidiphilus sp. ASG 303]|uniref:alpha-1,4-glucan--maltose-1-phosphate maltosyltransferase n=1 Tax=Streptacidiphilus sp. ASG 303 TaxID=2896847 RepID=UPI001E6513A7|nr:alpha-1,4-glucan--maltose-1-phosphate maltosyltransferase [Streptacidiphilus sp. ASG 303]MCD0483006.1 alpha-1,4-glucan--maltose-1-phosphate maltosyltransferase [Streptacidiphilus sp. ASG 303]